VAGGPLWTAVDPETDTIYATDHLTGMVSVINGQTNAVTATIPVVSDPSDVAVNPHTDMIYADNSAGGVSVINGQTDTVTQRSPWELPPG
jgi:YVTN family beta-propeller protein